jgi:hypothetical protein
MPANMRSHRVRRPAFSATGVFFAIGCAVVFAGPMQASAQTPSPWGLGNVQNIDVTAQSLTSMFEKNFVGVQAGGLWGNGDMTHPAGGAFASNANLSGGYGGLVVGTRCFPFLPAQNIPGAIYNTETGVCWRGEGSVNFGSISGTGAPNVGDEINRSKIGTFATLNAQVLIPLSAPGTRILLRFSNVGTGVRLIVGGGLAVGATKINFAGATTTDTRVGFNGQAGFIVPVSPGGAVRINYFIMNLGNTTIPTAAGNGRVDFWAQGVNFGFEQHF